jgi:hypothetical protein
MSMRWTECCCSTGVIYPGDRKLWCRASLDGVEGIALGSGCRTGATSSYCRASRAAPCEITYQLPATARKIHATGGEQVHLWRPPYELHNPTVDRIAQQQLGGRRSGR